MSRRAVLDRLASTTVSEPEPGGGGAGAGARHPAPLDVAPYSRVEASATCGADGVEEYCREMPGKRGVVCDSCEGAGGAPSRRHPARHAVDGDPGTWWQSPTLAAGDQYRDVSLTVTLPDVSTSLCVIIDDMASNIYVYGR
ncbi:hypothetical protein JYU34_002964 [Plutella xylostella]|uniref:Laminin N-terminal domain-containing protein n=1 Tax=Plutella xylostella TaxID=51655 RepID=A0ABQ7R3M4_PLUXY|nr:hypothetical protein JYU34_002964 [Plutella xylostella]